MMHKCPNCSCEYEGKFCPNCGTPWQEEKTCPSRGAKLNGSARFCNECGFSFYKAAEQVQEEKPKSSLKEKLKVAGAWVKSHLKIVIPTAVALVLVLILSIAIPVGVKNKTNGTYYQLKGGELDKKTYFILKSGSWEDEDGETGTYKKDGDKITFYAEFFGETEEITSGTLKDKVLTVDGKSYVSEKHKHSYGEWETTKEPTCKTNGLKARSCTCGVKETEILLATGVHTYEWQTTVEPTCTKEGEKVKVCKWCGTLSKQQSQSINALGHNYLSGRCTRCGIPQPTQGLRYELNSDKQSYSVAGMGSANVTELIIPSSYNGKPVTAIGNHAFYHCRSLTSVTIPDSVTRIGKSAFEGCDGLIRIMIPDSVTGIDNMAFYDTAYYNDESNWENDKLYIGKYLIATRGGGGS